MAYMRLALKFAYDGRNFYGYARQPNLNTVEDNILKLLIEKGFIKNSKESNYKVASRTDKCVSALGNVIAFNTDYTKKHAFKDLIGDFNELIFYGIASVNYDFYPRHAKFRIYRYYLKKQNFKLDEILSVISCFTGNHNFNNFARVEAHKDPIRIIYNILLEENDDFFIIDFYAQTYLWHQIRRIISAVIKVCNGKNTLEDIIYALDNPDIKFDFGLAAAESLILKDVIYDFDFEYDKYYMKKLNDLEKRIIYLLN